VGNTLKKIPNYFLPRPEGPMGMPWADPYGKAQSHQGTRSETKS